MMLGMDFLERFVGQAQLLHNTGAVVLDEDVVVGQHLEEQRLATLVAQVDRDRSLVGVPVDEVVRVDLGAAADPSARVADAGLLNLDHIGAVPGQRLGAGSSRLVLGHVEDSESVESWHRGVLPRRRNRAVKIFTIIEKRVGDLHRSLCPKAGK